MIYPPTTEAGWNLWASGLATLLESGPIVMGVPEPLSTAFVEAAQGFATAYVAASTPETTTAGLRQAKRTALAALKDAAKPVVAYIQANPDVTDQERVECGIRVRDTHRTIPGVIPFAPRVSVQATSAVTVRVSALDPNDEAVRRKPAGCKAIACRVHFGSQYPADFSTWFLSDMSGRSTFDLAWPELAEPATIWVVCQYLNTRLEGGPYSEPVQVRLLGNGGIAAEGAGATDASATSGDDAMKIAA